MDPNSPKSNAMGMEHRQPTMSKLWGMEAGQIERDTPYDIYSNSDIKCYVCRHFIEVSTATKSDVESEHSKGEQNCRAGKFEFYTSTIFICILEITLREICVTSDTPAV